MASREKLPSVRCYTIGWIAALTHEHLAATCMFDGDEHDFPDDFEKQPQDTNQYSLGKIGQHNVVITSIPDGEYGTVPAATTASNLVHSFPHIRIGLMVGIGAGLPKVKDMTVVEEYDIRLGDVVISLPNGNSPGVVQYDLGKMKAKKFERVGFLAAPPEVLRTGLTIMRGNHRKRGSKVPDILRKMVEEYPRLGKYDRQNRSHGFVHQGTENDRLFDASAPHFDAEGSCSQCNAKLEIRRDLRDSTDPFFYYGTIASGNSVVKNGMVRDVILQSLSDDCLCFEMEAAGLMNRFPCLVIRGICDYADSHKNDRWQNYAAATAAAYAKELLQYLQPNKVETERSIREVLGTSQ